MQGLTETDRIVDVRQELVPDYDYDKLLAEYSDSILGAYIRRMRRGDMDAVRSRALEYGVNALLGYEL